jgi:hypothetical protein
MRVRFIIGVVLLHMETLRGFALCRNPGLRLSFTVKHCHLLECCLFVSASFCMLRDVRERVFAFWSLYIVTSSLLCALFARRSRATTNINAGADDTPSSCHVVCADAFQYTPGLYAAHRALLLSYFSCKQHSFEQQGAGLLPHLFFCRPTC